MELKISVDEATGLFQEIMENEIRIRPRHFPNTAFGGTTLRVSACASDFYCLVVRISEIARSSFVSRSYNRSYNLCSSDMVFESVGAHANLMSSVMTAALDFRYGYGFGTKSDKLGFSTLDNYSYREIMETVRLHDIAENVTGDSADNGNRDEAEKDRLELQYLKGYLNLYSPYEADLKAKILRLFKEMQGRSSDTGRLMYLADKISALIITICLDDLGHPPLILEASSYASERDREEMKMCDEPYEHAYKASEMWAIDFFQLRDIVDDDIYFFFTALIVMFTLAINGKWYTWREKLY